MSFKKTLFGNLAMFGGWTKLFYILAACVLDESKAFITGAGGCEGGVAAVAGLHTTTGNGKNVYDGSISSGSVTILISHHVLNPEIVQDLPIGQDLEVMVRLSSGSFRGVLLRLEAMDDSVETTGALLPLTNTQDAAVCFDPIVGITHTDNFPKNEASGVLRLDEETKDVLLDITLVIENSATASSYLFSRFRLNFVSSESSTIPLSSPAVKLPHALPSSASPPLTLTYNSVDATSPSLAPSPIYQFDAMASIQPTEKSRKEKKAPKQSRDESISKQRDRKGMMIGKRKNNMKMRNRRKKEARSYSDGGGSFNATTSIFDILLQKKGAN